MADRRDRRQFLISIATTGTVAVAVWPNIEAAGTKPEKSKYNVLTAKQGALVAAIADQFIPADDFPGGSDAGVASYIDDILAGPFGQFYKSNYEEGLAAIDRLSRAQFGNDFVSLSSDQQQSVLKAFETGKDVSPTEHKFFGLILAHTYEGYYGDPGHGANRGGASWKMIGFQG